MSLVTDLARAEARLPKWMMAWSAAGAFAVLLTGGTRFAAGFLAGAAVALLNYFWLHQALEVLFAGGGARVPRRLVAKFVLRYPLLFAGAYLLYRTGWLPYQTFLAGLFVPVAGVLAEAAVQIREGWSKT